MKLALFDIDETLVKVIDIHRKAFSNTMHQVFGVECQMDEIDYSGNPLKKNLLTAASLKGVPPLEQEEKIEAAVGLYGTLFSQAMPDTHKVILPGVVDLLSFLKKEGYFLAVVTGDTEFVAETILDHTELRDYFHFLVTSDHFKNRKQMVKKAVSLAEKEIDGDFEKIYVIGDSVHDIDSAKGIGVSIGVATGRPSKEVLQSHNPDYLLDDLTQAKEVFQ